jgi:hypothetical protein
VSCRGEFDPLLEEAAALEQIGLDSTFVTICGDDPAAAEDTFAPSGNRS